MSSTITPIELRGQLDALKKTISKPPPFCSGTRVVNKDLLDLFYAKGDVSGRINFSDASEEELERLIKACDPATFGLNGEDVLDESYRKAWKLDSHDFSSRFDVIKSQIAKHVQDELLDDERTLQAELYKLNIYGKGSFFKAHKDTPRGDNMFGSLVIVFPTEHTGGDLILRHGGDQWTIDSEDMLPQKSTPSVGFIALYSDVEHEVTKVESGYRVTLTYNLFFRKPALPRFSPVLHPNVDVFESTLASLLDDPTFLPEGGKLGFGLVHQYPVQRDTDFCASDRYLKGTDRTIWRACKNLDLSVSLQVLYLDDHTPQFFTTYGAVDLDDYDGSYGHEISQHLKETDELTAVKFELEKMKKINKYNDYTEILEGDGEIIHWVTDIKNTTQVSTPYIAFGNEASLGYLYGSYFLVVHVYEARTRWHR